MVLSDTRNCNLDIAVGWQEGSGHASMCQTPDVGLL